MAHWDRLGEQPAAYVSSAAGEAYRPAHGKGEAQPEAPGLYVWIADHSGPTWRWRRLKHLAATLSQAKGDAERFLAEHPGFRPAALRDAKM